MSDGFSYPAADLLLRFTARDPDAFAEVFNRYYSRLLHFARRFVSLEVAEDILSETFLKLWHRVDQFTSFAAVEQWLRVTTRNACIDQLRKAQADDTRTAQYAALSTDQYDAAYVEASLEALLFARILHAIDKLPPQTREVVKLAFVDGLSVDDIAHKLGLSRQVVYNKKSLGLKALRLQFGTRELALLWVVIVAAC